jgi:hypothetical protein
MLVAVEQVFIEDLVLIPVLVVEEEVVMVDLLLTQQVEDLQILVAVAVE